MVPSPWMYVLAQLNTSTFDWNTHISPLSHDVQCFLYIEWSLEVALVVMPRLVWSAHSLASYEDIYHPQQCQIGLHHLLSVPL